MDSKGATCRKTDKLLQFVTQIRLCDGEEYHLN